MKHNFSLPTSTTVTCLVSTFLPVWSYVSSFAFPNSRPEPLRLRVGVLSPQVSLQTGFPTRYSLPLLPVVGRGVAIFRERPIKNGVRSRVQKNEREVLGFWLGDLVLEMVLFLLFWKKVRNDEESVSNNNVLFFERIGVWISFEKVPSSFEPVIEFVQFLFVSCLE